MMVTRYFITNEGGDGVRRVVGPEFETRAGAQAYIRWLKEPPKRNPGGALRTARRNTGLLGGDNVRNPRIIKREVMR